MSRTLRTLGWTLAAGVIAGLLWWQQTRTSDLPTASVEPAPVVVGSAPPAPVREAFPAKATPVRRDAPRINLPPPNSPLASVLPTLERAARAGDVGAMCRLAFEQHRCAVALPRQRRLVEAMAKREEGSDDASKRQARDKFLLLEATRLQALEGVCEGAHFAPDLVGWRLLRDAANAGHVPSMLRFVQAFPIDDARVLQHLDALEEYGRYAPVFMKRAAESGDRRAASAMLWEMSGFAYHVVPWFQVVKPDPAEELAYALAVNEIADEKSRQLLGRRIQALYGRLGRDDVNRAEQRASTLVSRFPPEAEPLSGSAFRVSKDGEDCRLP